MTHTAARVERVLWVACPVILFVVMFGHRTALVFNALALMALGVAAAACSASRPSLWHWPLMLPIAGWAGWRSPAGAFGTLLYLGYGLLFMLAGRPDNSYWGAMIAPAMFIGLAFAPRAMTSLALAAFPRPQPEPLLAK